MVYDYVGFPEDVGGLEVGAPAVWELALEGSLAERLLHFIQSLRCVLLHLFDYFVLFHAFLEILP